MTLNESLVTYKVFKQKKSWDDARSHCMSLGGELAMFANQEELDLVINVNESSLTKYWIGLQDVNSDGTLKWINGGNMEWANWRGGEPNRSGRCGYMLAKTGQWGDHHCSVEYGFICKGARD